MIKKSITQKRIFKSLALSALMAGGVFSQLASAADITISVEDQTTAAVSGFRYLVEEDTTFKPVVGVEDVTRTGLSFEFHKSHNPVAVADQGLNKGEGISGSTTASMVSITVPDNKNYFVSVVPFNGHALSGVAVEVGIDDVAKTVRVNTFPLPTAQISVRVFEDSNPINGAIDRDERGLSFSTVSGQKVYFGVKLFDAAGQYGAAGGEVTQDAYGNPLGTKYNAAGTIISTPADTNGFILTPDADGYLVIKNLPPAKYGIQVVPPAGADWVQTSTIEGTKTIDAWVKANEPETFVEFGPPGPHVFVGFVHNFDCMNGDEGFEGNACTGYTQSGAGTTIHGQVVNNHMSRSPSFQFANGTPFEGCRVGVNLGIAGKTIYSQPCGDEAFFSIPNLPAGSYSLSIWDDGLDIVIANHPFNVTGSSGNFLLEQPLAINGSGPGSTPCDGTTGCDLGEIPVFNWNHQLDTVVYFDKNKNGIRDGVDEVTLHADSSATNIRFRDGRIYKSVPIDVEGAAPHEEVFPFFHWLVAEVDFANFKATGATMITDAGGDGADLQDDGYVAQFQNIPSCASDPIAEGGCSYDGGDSRTESGTILTQAFQGFLGQKNTIEFGKTNYGPGENGGISGVAVYAITRAEDDPRYAAAEEWEPGIPRVQLALYEDFDNDKKPGSAATFQAPDVDNYPLGWADGGTRGDEDVDHNDNGTFDQGDAIEVTWTDSWDDSLPTGCQGANDLTGLADDKCFDGLRNWNQIRPGVFDGGYAFSEDLPEGNYIVQSFTPPGYTLLKEEDKNVDFGDEYAVPQLLPPICVGGDHPVPLLLSHVTDDGGINQIVNGDPADFAAPYAGELRKLCDMKHIRVADGKNAAADFHYFTEVPKAAHVVGGVINDLANEFNPNSPTFGEKFAPPWVPVAFYDFNGYEITRVYSDQFGKYNAMLPSTNTVNIGSPSGVAPNMITACMNDAGLVDNPNYTTGSGLPQKIIDPNYNPQYSQFCYTFQYMPGATTYLDTPVLQTAAFAGSGLQLDCEAADKTPMISSVTGSGYVGPYIANSEANNAVDRMLTISSTGARDVLNPSSDELTDKFVSRDYGFGTTTGVVTLIDKEGTAYDLDIVSWGDLLIEAATPGLDDGQYQLIVTTNQGVESPMAVTVTVGEVQGIVSEVLPSNAAGATPIQDALDASGKGDLILVAEGVYNELPVMYLPVALQGAGAYSTIINARSLPAEKIEDWRTKVLDLLLPVTGNTGQNFDLIPGQGTDELFVTEEGAGLMVVAKRTGSKRFKSKFKPGIDGFTVTGASTGGGIFLSAFIDSFTISNNLVTGNNGTYGGGIRLGHSTIKEEFLAGGEDELRIPDTLNRNVKIRYNMITKNGTFNGAGGGISLYTGSKNYRVTDNLICGNFASTDGAGIGHLGKSNGGKIFDNTIIFNQSFRQTPGFETDGGGILIAGADSPDGNLLSDGSGNVTIERNLIQGNQAGAGDGGGIALRRVNGKDIEDADEEPEEWWRVRVFNNTIVNNMAGYAGGGISLLDAARVSIKGNTIVNNESTATAGAAFNANSPGQSSPQVAGIVSRKHVTILNEINYGEVNFPFTKEYSNPVIRDNIIFHNTSNHYVLTSNSLIDDGYLDLGVVPPSLGLLNPRRNFLTDETGYHGSNHDELNNGDSFFVREYDNGNPFLNPSPTEFQTVQVAPALDEGGNWIDVRYAPLSINDVDLMMNGDQPSNYHLDPTSGNYNRVHNRNPGSRAGQGFDIDGEPQVGSLDIGSDEDQ